ncbi:MAG TPA: hypothetical protein DCW44_02855 [Eubacterium sp.]|nr:hypothetical protein [Eubacterium sp.]
MISFSIISNTYIKSHIITPLFLRSRFYFLFFIFFILFRFRFFFYFFKTRIISHFVDIKS